MTIKFIEKNEHLKIEQDGKELLSIPSQSLGDSDLKYYSEDIDKELSLKICSSLASDIPKGLGYFSEFESEIFPNANWIDFKKENGSVQVKLSITFSWEEWNHPFTIQEFLESYKNEMSDIGFKTEINKDDGWAYFDIIFFVLDGIVLHRIDEVIHAAKKEYQSLVVKLARAGSENIFVKVFNFPKEYESICTQYLVWFGEFLLNLGIDADVSAENNRHQTSLIVSPKEAPELLIKIEQLFYQYLSLPYIEYSPAQAVSASVEDKYLLQMLFSQVENFKNQIQMKDAVIEMKELSIASLKENLHEKEEKILLIQSMKNAKDIEIFGGAISLGEIKLGPLKLDPKKLLDAFKGDV
ncbi:MAG: hypothetical protein Q8L79_00695 [Methylobacter sp.]|uniref:hypothetical protein n=1 Tax=Methylobacter sp. TaxID=2051955 RepID=UPI002731ABB1|nr:hypothetical protein [Methylobacter sp.]MDP1663616.1 hypothetical protein [Methylobacter sp.]